MNKTLLQLGHSFLVALATAALTFFQGVDINQLGTGTSAILAGAGIAILVRGAGFLVNLLGPKPS